MAERPMFSVVIASHNAERTLPSTVRSVLAQTREDFEILVVDDGSTDGTEQALRAIPDDRITYVRQQNLGPAKARNAGIERAAGEYVSFLDSDDLWLPDYLGAMAAAFDSDVEADLAYTDAWRLDDVTRRVHRRTIMSGQRPPRHPPSEAQALLAALLERNFVYTSATARRGVLERVGGFRTVTRSEDYELWLHIAASGSRFVNTRRILAVYRDRPGSRIHDRIAMRRGSAEIYEHVLATYELTATTRSVAERRLAEMRREVATLAAEAACPHGAKPRSPLRQRAHELRVYRRRPPHAVSAAFPDLRAI